MDPWRHVFQKFSVAAVVLTSSVFPALGDIPDLPSPLFKGVNYTAWAAEKYATPASDASLSLLKETGANWVAILVTEYMATKRSTKIYADRVLTPSESSLIHVVHVAHAYGFKVMLKLHVDPKDGTWRGQISPSDVRKWFENYQDRVLHYAKLAERCGVELFCLGTELRSLSGEPFRSYWESLVTAVRKVFTGPLVYAANWDEFQTVSFWDLLDYVGIDAYFPLSHAQTPAVEELLRAWEFWIPLLEPQRDRIGKPVIFTEIGYRSVDYTAKEPWEWAKKAPYNAQAQANGYEAVLRAFWGRPWWAGLFLWNWLPDPNAGGPGDLDYTPQNKPAQEVLTKFFGGRPRTSPESTERQQGRTVFLSDENGQPRCLLAYDEGLRSGENGASFDPVSERKEVMRGEQSISAKAVTLKFQTPKEV